MENLRISTYELFLVPQMQHPVSLVKAFPIVIYGGKLCILT